MHEEDLITLPSLGSGASPLAGPRPPHIGRAPRPAARLCPHAFTAPETEGVCLTCHLPPGASHRQKQGNARKWPGLRVGTRPTGGWGVGVISPAAVHGPGERRPCHPNPAPCQGSEAPRCPHRGEAHYKRWPLKRLFWYFSISLRTKGHRTKPCAFIFSF